MTSRAERRAAERAAKKHSKTTMPSVGGGAVASPQVQPSGAQLEAALQAGLVHHRAGRQHQAAEIYDHLLSILPDNAVLLHLRGVIHHEVGDPELGLSLIDRAIKIDPTQARFHHARGEVKRSAGDNEAAVTSFEIALSIDPTMAGTLVNLGLALQDLGRHPDAVTAFKKAQELAPRDPVVLCNLGRSHFELKEYDDAEPLLRDAVEQAPKFPEALANLAAVVHVQATLIRGDKEKREELLEEALEFAERAQKLQPDNYKVAFNIGTLHQDLLNVRMADAKFRAAADVAERIDDVVAMCKVAQRLESIGNMQEAFNVIVRAQKLAPRDLNVVRQYIYYHGRMNKFDEAFEALDWFREAGATERDFGVHAFNIYQSICDFSGVDSLGDLIELAEAGGSAVFLGLLPLTESEEQVHRLLEVHKEHAEGTCTAWGVKAMEAPAIVKSTRRMRIGMLSSDLMGHSVTKFSQPLVDHYDPDRMDLLAYTPLPPRGTDAEKKLTDQLTDIRYIHDKTDEQAAELIRDDDVDVLVEMNGLTAHTRLMVGSYRPAPLQVSWLGYPFSGGYPGYDYFLVDEYLAPTDKSLLQEDSLIMPRTWIPYDAPKNIVPAERAPHKMSGRVTFGTLNNTYKFSRQSIETWAEVMRQVPDSTMLLVQPRGRSMKLRENLVQLFVDEGIEADRVAFFDNWASRKYHLSCYDDIDISLDTFPLTGGTTTIEALHMGVPVVSMRGPAMHQRISHAILCGTGVPELSVETREEFVQTAVSLASDPERIQTYRATLRDKMLASPFLDFVGYGRDFADTMEGALKKAGYR